MKKLVRDLIPLIIPQNNKTSYKFSQANPTEYWEYLKMKLIEEATEFKESESEEELADIFEVIEAILQWKGWSYDQIRDIQNSKATERGKFSGRVILEVAKEPSNDKKC